MLTWPYPIQVLSFADIKDATRCPHWQSFRISLKGLTTQGKLERLKEYLDSSSQCIHCTFIYRRIQVDNYLNALKRGGQLSIHGDVLK